MLYVRIAEGSANRKLTDRTDGKRDSTIWIVNPVGFATEAEGSPEARKGRTFSTCPTTCEHLPARFGGHKDGPNDCYADGPIVWTADKVPGEPWAEALGRIAVAAALGRIRLVRWAVVGDRGRTATDRKSSDAFLRRLQATLAPHGIPVIVYSHAWHGDRAPFLGANASCDTVEEIDAARALGWQPVMVAADVEAGKVLARIDGVRGFLCPEQQGRVDGCVGCSSAPLCARDRSGATLVLTSH